VNRPEVSVVTAVWDRYCSLLPGAVESVLSQEGPAAEVVVVDNASRTPLPRLPDGAHVVQAPRRLSIGASRNIGLSHAAAPCVLFLDADDRLLPGALAHLHGEIAGRPDVVLAAGATLGWNAETDKTARYGTMPLRRAYWLAPYRRAFALANLLTYLPPVTGAGLMRRDAALAAGGFTDGEYGEDWGLAAALAFHGRVVLTRTPVRIYRLERGSLYFRRHPRSTVESALRALRRHVREDGAVPAYAKALMPLVALGHRVKVRRLTPGGFEDPTVLYLGGPHAAASGPEAGL
jgi:glycosyltransferase involved in cell wall biosynthesis